MNSRLSPIAPLCALALSVLLGACESRPPAETLVEVVPSLTAAGQPCAAATASTPRAAEAHVVITGNEGPCRVVAVTTGARLLPSYDASRPDPSWVSIVRDGRGRFYSGATMATGAGRVLRWETDGTYGGSIGSPGAGPGELSPRGLLMVFVGPGDSLYVREAPRWSVFDPSGQFGRVINAAGVQSVPTDTHITHDGGFLLTGPTSGGSANRWFHLFDAEGAHQRSFGEIQAGEPAGRPRKSAYAGGSTFWAAPPEESRRGYVLEEWGLDGELRRTIERHADWIDDADAGIPGLAHPYFASLTVDDAGRLWIVMMVKDRRWRELRPGEDRDELASELYDLRYEVIDPDAGRLLSSGLIDLLPDEQERNTPPIARILPGSRTSYRPLTDSLGFQTIEFYDLQLVEPG